MGKFLDKLLGRDESQNGNQGSEPITITGISGSSYDVPSTEDTGDKDYRTANDGYAPPYINAEQEWANFSHRRSPNPALPADQDTSLYDQTPGMTTDKVANRFDMTTPQPSTNEVVAGGQLSPYLHPEQWRPSYRILRPSTWEFERVFDRPPRELNGSHYSMADNIRKYPVGGMRTAPNLRNTYRLTPDTNDRTYVDMPPASEMPPVSFDSPAANSSSSAYRLG